MAQEDLDGVKSAWEAISANDFARFIEAADPEVLPRNNGCVVIVGTSV